MSITTFTGKTSNLRKVTEFSVFQILSNTQGCFKAEITYPLVPVNHTEDAEPIESHG